MQCSKLFLFRGFPSRYNLLKPNKGPKNVDFCGILNLLAALKRAGFPKAELEQVAARIAAQTGATILISFWISLQKAVLNGSNPPVSGDLAPMVYVNNKLYQYADSQPSLTDKESQFIYLGEIESKVSSSQEPKENFQANDDIVGAKVYQYENDIVILIDGKYFLYSNLENAENETVEFEGQLSNKSDLSEETLKWLEWYNSLPPEKQLTVSSIPAELYIDDGAGTVDADQEK